MQVPVRRAPRKPARDFRGEKRRDGMRGKWVGRGGVWGEKRRPRVDAAVSDHERLRSRSVRD